MVKSAKRMRMAKRPAIGGKPQVDCKSEHRRKTPAIGGEGPPAATEKYYLRSQHWDLQFTLGKVKLALATIVKLNKNNFWRLARIHWWMVRSSV